MGPSRELLEILVCPESKESLLYFPEGDPERGGEPFLFAATSRLRYPIRDGVPVMLVSEAERVSAEEASRLAGAAPKPSSET